MVKVKGKTAKRFKRVNVTTTKRSLRPQRISYYRVEPGPDMKSESKIAYYQEAPQVMEEEIGAAPCRASMANYLKYGYPVARGGPFVEMPVEYLGKRPWTTVEALQRFGTLVRSLQ